MPEVIAELIEAAELPQQQWRWMASVNFGEAQQIQFWVNERGDRLEVVMQSGHYTLNLNDIPLVCS